MDPDWNPSIGIHPFNRTSHAEVWGRWMSGCFIQLFSIITWISTYHEIWEAIQHWRIRESTGFWDGMDYDWCTSGRNMPFQKKGSGGAFAFGKEKTRQNHEYHTRQNYILPFSDGILVLARFGMRPGYRECVRRESSRFRQPWGLGSAWAKAESFISCIHLCSLFWKWIHSHCWWP